MRLQSIGARLSSTVGVAVVSSVITTMVLTGGYAVATTVLPDNSVSSINIVDGTIRGRDLSARLRDRIATPGPQGPAGPAGPQGPAGVVGLHEVRLTFPGKWNEYGGCSLDRCDWEFPLADPDRLALSLNEADYPMGATVRADFHWQADGPGEACVRLYDLTAGAPIEGTELCHVTPGDEPAVASERTGSSALPPGDHRLVWQMSSDACCSYVFDASLIIEWP